MKKRILTVVCLLILGAARTFAQTSATVTLNITLSDVLSITAATTSVAFTFDSEAKYNNGITTTVDNQLNVLSSRNYLISVEAGTVTGASSLAPGSVSVQAGVGSTGGVYTGITSYPVVTLSSTVAAPLVTSTTSTFGTGANTRTFFEVIYTVGANNAYVGKTTGTNAIPVLYTLTQP